MTEHVENPVKSDGRQPVQGPRTETPQGPLFDNRPLSLDTKLYTLLHSNTPVEIVEALARACLQSAPARRPTGDRLDKIVSRLEKCARELREIG